MSLESELYVFSSVNLFAAFKNLVVKEVAGSFVDVAGFESGGGSEGKEGKGGGDSGEAHFCGCGRGVG